MENIYTTHHRQRRRRGYTIFGEKRGKFLHDKIGVGKRVLDIGCRDGALTSYFCQGNNVVGLDIDSQALAAAKNLGIEIRHIDLNGEWGIPDSSFDVVVAAEVLEHLYYPEVVIQKIYKALKPGGIILGSIPYAFSLQNRFRYLIAKKDSTPLADPTHINHFTVKEFSHLFNGGFINFRLYPIISPRLAILALILPNAFAHSFMFEARKNSTESKS